MQITTYYKAVGDREWYSNGGTRFLHSDLNTTEDEALASALEYLERYPLGYGTIDVRIEKYYCINK